MERRRSILPALLMSFALAACGGDSPTTPVVDDGGDDGGDNSGGETRVIKANPSFSADIQEIFGRRGCTASGCHGNGSGGLTLGSDPAANHGQLVGVTSPTSGEVRVIANDANNSYLVKKLEGRQGNGNGSRMPLGGGNLDTIDLTNIKNWINTGAANN